MKPRKTILASLVCVLASAAYANAGDLVYTPISPSFGGNPFNSAHLLAIAEIGRPDDPDDGAGGLFGSDLSQAEQFTQQLQSRILSQISFDIVDTIFNGDTQNGTFQFDATTLSFEKLLDGSVSLVITDATTGGVTNILIPSFLAAQN